jgi:hypothetical protein
VGEKNGLVNLYARSLGDSVSSLIDRTMEHYTTNQTDVIETIKLSEYLRHNRIIPTLIKMDIEGGEVDWIRSLLPEHMDVMTQIVMEFHRPFSETEINMFKKLNETHLPIHFHPNNACGTRIHNGIYFPNVFECTYLHKRFFNGYAELNRDFIPNDAVDVRNILFKDEIWIGHPPFVFSETFVRKL